jgi:hypothetical protein
VNAWGDSIRGREFYGKLNPANTASKISRASVLDNGFKKVKEVEDGVIEQALEGNAPKTFDTLTEFTPERKQEIITNFATKHKMTEEQAKNYINDALQKDAQNTINKLKECY